MIFILTMDTKFPHLKGMRRLRIKKLATVQQIAKNAAKLGKESNKVLRSKSHVSASTV